MALGRIQKLDIQNSDFFVSSLQIVVKSLCHKNEYTVGDLKFGLVWTSNCQKEVGIL